MRRQKASTSGNHNTIVQIIGNGNTTVIRGADKLMFSLDTASEVSGTFVRDIDLLNPKLRSIELIGRENDFHSLHKWLDDDVRISVRAITGRGGAGKTRLAIEIMHAKLKNEWQVGFLSSENLSRYTDRTDAHTLVWNLPSLITIDYASACTGQLKILLNELANHPEREKSGHPLRILLLERDADPNQGWFADLLPGGWDREKVESIFESPFQPHPLTAIRSDDRRAVIREVFDIAPSRSQKTPPRIPDPGENLAFDHQISRDVFRDPLTLMMAALVALDANHNGLMSALSLSRTDLAERLALREFDRIRRFAPSEGDESHALAHVAACAVMVGGFEHREDLNKLTREECEALSRTYTGGIGSLVSHLADALTSETHIGRMVPDILAEAFVLKVFTNSRLCDEHMCKDAVLRTIERKPESALPFIMRLIQDFSEQHPHSLSWLGALIDKKKDNTPWLFRIEQSLPNQTMALRELAARVDDLLLKSINPSESPNVYAGISNNLANRLSDLGRREEALIPAQRAVQLYEQLALSNPDAFLPDLAGSLNNLALTLSSLGKRDDALVPAQRAVEIHEQLASSNPDAFLPYLAMSLNNLANMLSDLGRMEEALVPAQRAVDIREQLASSNPDAFLPGLAASLNNLALTLSSLGKREEALIHAQRAVGIQEQLASSNPDAFLPGLARSLNNLALTLSSLGRMEEALAQAQRAVDIRESLASSNPDAFLPDLATSLNNLANFLSDLGRREEALVPAQRAVQLYEQLALSNPDAFLPDLAGSLNNLANRLSDLGRREEALVQAQRAVDIREQLALSNPDAFLPDLARSYGSLSRILMQSERYADASKVFHSGIEALFEPFKRYPQAFAPMMRALVQDYLEASQQAGLEIDFDLIPLVIAELNALDSENND